MTRSECKENATNFCRSQLSQGKVLYFVLDNIGKEDILSHVAEALRVEVVVTEDKYQLVKCMGLSKHFTTNRQGGRVFCVCKSKFNYKKAIAGITAEHCHSEVVFVKISGMRRGQNCLSYEYIKFSDHSCMKEIEIFFASLCYKSACPIMSKVEKPSVNSPPNPEQTENTSTSKLDTDKIKVKLRKNKEEQTSFSITSEFENTAAVSYRVVTGLSTDEEAGNSPETSIFSPCQYPGRSCSTPIHNVNCEDLQEHAIYHDHSSRESHPSSEMPYCYFNGSGSPDLFLMPYIGTRSSDMTPYIEPPIPLELDWLPSPIKCQHNGTVQSYVKLGDCGGLSSLGDEMSPDIDDESSVKVNRQVIVPKVSPKFVFPNCEIEIIANSPVYMNGKVYPSRIGSPTIEKEQVILNGGGVELDNHKSNVSTLYEEMFRETQLPGEVVKINDFTDGIEVLNDTPDSVETLYVSDTESESEDGAEKAGPIGDYLRGQYALNQMFNSTVINIRETFNTSTLSANYYSSTFKQRKKITEDDLAESRIELLLPKVVCSPEITVKNDHTSESEAVRQTRYFRESKNEYFRQLSEITKKCHAITYNKKPKKIGKSLPVSRALYSDSIHLLNDYTDVTEGHLRDLARKLTVDKILPKTMPVLEIKKRPLSPETKTEVIVSKEAQILSGSNTNEYTITSIPKETLQSPMIESKKIRQSPNIECKKIRQSPIVECKKTRQSPIVECMETVCIPRSSTPKSSKGIKNTAATIVNDKAKKKQRLKTPSLIASQSSDDIFDMIFGSTPTSMAVKRIKKRTKESTSRKRINTAENNVK